MKILRYALTSFVLVNVVGSILFWYTVLPHQEALGQSFRPKCVSIKGLPDKTCTAGEINPQITQANIKQTICNTDKKKWNTGMIRPPSSYTDKLKQQGMIDYNLPLNPSLYEEDHKYPLIDSGNATDPNNLWPEPYSINVDGFEAGARTKDKLEVKFNKLLCSGKKTLKDVPICFDDWINCYKEVIGELPKFVSSTNFIGASID